VTEFLIGLAAFLVGGGLAYWAMRHYRVQPLRAQLTDTETDLNLANKALAQAEADRANLETHAATGANLVERYHFALTGPAGIGDPNDHLVALFAHWGKDYTPPADPVDE
jgi:hypothetical protein